MLELKTREGQVGAKQAYPVAPFILDDGFCRQVYEGVLRRSSLPDRVKRYARERVPTLCNRYYRWYYATRDQRFRITVDTEMTFYQVRPLRNHFARKHVDHRHTVLEIKYGKVLYIQADRVAGFFPFSMTKHSKYVVGIELVYP
jgi:hypothetical protein